MKPDGFAAGFRAEQISHRGLEQDKIPLQPGGRVVVRLPAGSTNSRVRSLAIQARLALSLCNRDSVSLAASVQAANEPKRQKSSSRSGKLPAGLHHHRLIKSLLALEVVTDPSHIGPGALGDFPKVRSVKTSLGEQFTGDLEHSVAGGQGAPGWAGWPICFFALLDSHTKPTYAVAVPTACAMQNSAGYSSGNGYTATHWVTVSEFRRLEKLTIVRPIPRLRRQAPISGASEMLAALILLDIHNVNDMDPVVTRSTPAARIAKWTSNALHKKRKEPCFSNLRNFEPHPTSRF